MNKVIFLHGLLSKAGGEKVDYLMSLGFEVCSPQINYKSPNAFKDVLAVVEQFKPDTIIGSSAGGCFAYHIARLRGIESILLNPAVAVRNSLLVY